MYTNNGHNKPEKCKISKQYICRKTFLSFNRQQGTQTRKLCSYISEQERYSTSSQADTMNTS